MSEDIKIHAICTSPTRGTIKYPVDEAEINNLGIISDSHSGKWHRQISLLSNESIKDFEEQIHRTLNPGAFGANLTLQGLDFKNIHVKDRLICNDVEIEVTQIGKECHEPNCPVFKEAGKCIMPSEGIFAKVIHGGKIHKQDTVIFKPHSIKTRIIVLSDRASKGEYADLSGKKIEEMIEKFYYKSEKIFETSIQIIPDDAEKFKCILKKTRKESPDIFITSGGTGIGSRDITIETVTPFLDKQIPGIMDYIRMKHASRKPEVLISRSVAGIMGKCLVFCLPGSTKAVEEYMTEIIPLFEHMMLMVHDEDPHK